MKKLTDEAMLAKVFVEDKELTVRLAAFERLRWIKGSGSKWQAALAKIAVESDMSGYRCLAVAMLTDQAVLAEVAVQAKDSDVRADAIAKLTDQTVLAKLAAEDKDLVARTSAIAKLTDQTVLAKLAAEDKDLVVRSRAVANLTDQTTLAKVAVDDKDLLVRRTAVAKLTDQTVLAKVAAEDKDWHVRYDAYLKLHDSRTLAEFAAAADPTTRLHTSILLRMPAILKPIPEKHTARLRGEVLEILNLLTDRLVSAELGDVEDIRITWTQIRQPYTLNQPPYTLNQPPYTRTLVDGERFTVSVKLSKTHKVVSAGWTTNFPSILGTSQDWWPADIGNLDVPRDICGLLSAPTLAKIAIESEERLLRLAAIEKLTDQTLLAKVAAQDEVYEVRQKATARSAELRY